MHMRGASAEALAALRDQLDGALGLDAGSSAERVGDDLFNVASLLRREPGLRRVATDVSVDAAAKRNFAGQLFGGKVDPTALSLIEEAFARRWTAGRDLPAALEHLSEVAIVKSAGHESGRLADELFTVDRAIADNPSLRDALSDPQRSIDDKAALVDSLLGGKALPATVTLTKQALAGTYRTVSVALENYQKVAADVYGEGVATVRVAQPLSAADEQRLGQALARQYGREVHLNVIVDPTVLGGIKVEIGDDVIDGTVASRLDEAARRLAG